MQSTGKKNQLGKPLLLFRNNIAWVVIESDDLWENISVNQHRLFVYWHFAISGFRNWITCCSTFQGEGFWRQRPQVCYMQDDGLVLQIAPQLANAETALCKKQLTLYYNWLQLHLCPTHTCASSVCQKHVACLKFSGWNHGVQEAKGNKQELCGEPSCCKILLILSLLKKQQGKRRPQPQTKPQRGRTARVLVHLSRHCVSSTRHRWSGAGTDLPH